MNSLFELLPLRDSKVSTRLLLLSSLLFFIGSCAVHPIAEDIQKSPEVAKELSKPSIVTLTSILNPNGESEAEKAKIQLAVDEHIHEIALTAESSSIDKIYYPDFSIPENAFSALQSAFVEGKADYFYAIKTAKSVEVYQAIVSLSTYLSDMSAEIQTPGYNWKLVKTVKLVN